MGATVKGGALTGREPKVRAACEAAYVLNDAVGAFLIPQHLAKLAPATIQR
jgi:hypothetical protein